MLLPPYGLPYPESLGHTVVDSESYVVSEKHSPIEVRGGCCRTEEASVLEEMDCVRSGYAFAYGALWRDCLRSRFWRCSIFGYIRGIRVRARFTASKTMC